MPSDLRPPLAPPFDLFGVDAAVTPAGSGPIDTVVVWHAENAVLRVRSAFLLGVGEISDVRTVLSVKRSDVAALPIGSVISAPGVAGGPTLTWRVDERYDDDPEVWRAVVHAI